MLPPRRWPIAQIPFYTVAALLVLLSVIGLGAALLNRFAVIPAHGGGNPNLGQVQAARV
jgi:hypothetical protein